MFHIDIIAVGRMKQDPFAALWGDYAKRCGWKINLIELDGKSTADEHRKISEKITRDGTYTIMMDERGKAMRSLDFARKLEGLSAEGTTKIRFIIGGADGLSDELRKSADFLLSFGVQTWPHMLVRVMLIEQIYRAQQIIAGHPYHRES